MGPGEIMNNLSLNSNSDTTTLSVPKLRDDGSNWSDYQSRIERAMGSKGLWRHMLGTAFAPRLYMLLNGIPVLSDGTTEASSTYCPVYDFDSTWEQNKGLEDREGNVGGGGSRCDDKKHTIPSRTQTAFPADATTTGQPPSYRPTLQTITAAERASSLTSTSPQKMKYSDLIDFLLEEAQHRVINDDRSKISDHALMVNGKKGGRGRPDQRKIGNRDRKDAPEPLCYNCKRPGHKEFECWSKGGGREGQGPGQKRSAKPFKPVVAIADNEKEEMFAFTCTSDYANVAKALQVPKSKLGTCIDSGASEVYCPDRNKFANYKTIDRNITTADGRTLKAIGIGNLVIDRRWHLHLSR